MRGNGERPRIEIADLTKRYGDVAALDRVSLSVEPGELLVILGPSGSGKSTLLHVIAGLLEPDAGTVRIGGVDVTRVPAHKRSVPIVFQKHGLFPHLRALENVAFGLRMAGVARAEREARAREALADVQLEGFEDRYPNELSGGEAQRVAIARALVTRPRVLLMDEPFSSLDATLRAEMQQLLTELRARSRFTTVFVTHDQREAVRLGDRIAILRGGAIRQIGPAREVYDRPDDEETARFLGLTNVLPARVRDGRLHVDGIGAFPLPPEAQIAEGERVLAAFRPESVKLAAAGSAAGIPTRVASLRDHGQTVSYCLDSPAGPIDATELGPPRYGPGDYVRFLLDKPPWILPAAPLDPGSNRSAATPKLRASQHAQGRLT